jgi:hypothetical protein
MIVIFALFRFSHSKKVRHKAQLNDERAHLCVSILLLAPAASIPVQERHQRTSPSSILAAHLVLSSKPSINQAVQYITSTYEQQNCSRFQYILSYLPTCRSIVRPCSKEEQQAKKNEQQ